MSVLATSRSIVPDPAHRLRRFRRTASLRELVRETRLHPRQLVEPIFVQPGRGQRTPIPSMPGVSRLSPDEVVAEVRRLARLDLGGVILFGLYAQIEAAARLGWIDRRRTHLEAATAIIRAGASFVITYAAADLAAWLREGTD